MKSWRRLFEDYRDWPDDMQTVVIDGSMGEGGGQILRTSLALSCITGKPLRIENIRAARRKPGLAKQHLSCVRAVSRICSGRSDGAALGSQVLDFQPGPVRGGDYSFDIGSAGSASLVAQTVLPALFLAAEPSTLIVTGGTHNPWAPPFDFVAETFLPAIASAGFRADAELMKHGFFPAGGGRIGFSVQPRGPEADGATCLCEPPTKPQISALIYTARLPVSIAHRQQALLCQSNLSVAAMEHTEVTDSDGPGNCVMLKLRSVDRTSVFTAFGQKGKPSRKVVAEVAGQTRNYLSSGAAIDHLLADQLLIYMAIAEAGSFTTNELSAHLTTNMETVKRFLPVNFVVESSGRIHRISCAPASRNIWPKQLPR